MTYVITEPCIDIMDKACVEECPVDAIYEGLSMSYIHPDICVDCGACEPVCPVEAIFYVDDVPANWTRFVAAAEDFASHVPGGGARGLLYSLDSSLIFLSNDKRTARGSTEAAALPLAEPSPFFRDRAGTRLAVLWDSTAIDLEMVKALLLIFDKIALIGSGVRVNASTSETSQWELLVSMGLVAHVEVADAVAVVEVEPLRALFDVLLARTVTTPSASGGNKWRRAVVYDAFRRLGEPPETFAKAVPRDAATLEVVSTAICQMFEQALADGGVSATSVTTDRATADAFAAAAAWLGLTADTVTLPGEWVLPPCAAASVEQLLEFRDAAGPQYRRYAERLTDSMMSLSRRTDTAIYSATYSPDDVAEEARAVRRLMRGQPWLGRGYIGFGLIGNAGGPRLRNAQDIVQAFNQRPTTPMADVQPMRLFVVEPAQATWI